MPGNPIAIVNTINCIRYIHQERKHGSVVGRWLMKANEFITKCILRLHKNRDLVQQQLHGQQRVLVYKSLWLNFISYGQNFLYLMTNFVSKQMLYRSRKETASFFLSIQQCVAGTFQKKKKEAVRSVVQKREAYHQMHTCQYSSVALSFFSFFYLAWRLHYYCFYNIGSATSSSTF